MNGETMELSCSNGLGSWPGEFGSVRVSALSPPCLRNTAPNSKPPCGMYKSNGLSYLLADTGVDRSETTRLTIFKREPCTQPCCPSASNFEGNYDEHVGGLNGNGSRRTARVVVDGRGS